MTGFVEMEMSWALSWDEIQRLKPYGMAVKVPPQLHSIRRDECSAVILTRQGQDKLLTELDRSHLAGYASINAIMRLIGDIAGSELLGYLTVVEITYARTGFALLSVIHPQRLTEAEAYAKTA